MNTGEQTQITQAIRNVASTIRGKEEELIKNISHYINSMDTAKASKEPNFRRTADEIIKSHRFDGCNEAGVVFTALLRAKGKPATYIQAMDKKAFSGYSRQRPNLKGHVFIETKIDEEYRFVNSTTGEITKTIPNNYLEAARGLDSWDIGLKERFTDLQKMFEDKRLVKDIL